jgi:hypothetical protein
MHLPFLRLRRKLSPLVYLPFLKPQQKNSHVFVWHVVKCHGEKNKKQGAREVFPKTKRRKILIVCRCRIVLGSTPNRHLFEEWLSPHGLVPYTFWCRPFQVYFQVHLLCFVPALLQSNLISPFNFARWGHAPKFPSYTNFSDFGSNQCWAYRSENPDTSSDIKN